MSVPSSVLEILAQEADRPALAAVSGGRDSVALLHMLVSAGRRDLVVCHLNHGLRGRESGQDAAFVRRLAARYGLACEVEKADIRRWAKASRQTLEEAGRAARMAFFERAAHKHAAACVFLAHHAEDQAETQLANLCRGTGLRGLAGMKISTQMGRLRWVRPLLGMRKTEIDDYVRGHHLAFREDSSNSTPDYTRNRLRNEVIPLLNEVFQRDVPALLLRLGEQARRDDACLARQARDVLASVILDDGQRLNYRPLLCMDAAMRTRVLELWLREICQVSRVDARMVENAQQMMNPAYPARLSLPGKRFLRRKNGQLWVE